MTQILIIIKILPTDIDVNLDTLLDDLKNSLEDDIIIRNSIKEPLAFGIYYLKIEFIIDEKNGSLDKLEEIIKSISGVSESEVLKMSRLSVNIT